MPITQDLLAVAASQYLLFLIIHIALSNGAYGHWLFINHGHACLRLPVKCLMREY